MDDITKSYKSSKRMLEGVITDKNLSGVGIGLIIIGLVYWLKPNIFQRWFWKRTSILQRTLGPEKYLVFMKGFGICLTVVGVIFYLWIPTYCKKL